MQARNLTLLIACAAILSAAPDKDHVMIVEPDGRHTSFPQNALDYVDAPRAAVFNPDKVSALLDIALKSDPVLPHDGDKPGDPRATNLDYKKDDFFCIVHIMRWKDPAGTPDNELNKTQTVDKQNWYVYHAGNAWRQEDFTDRQRLFGSKNVWLLFIHLNARKQFPYDIRYEFDLTDLTPAPLQHLLDLAALFAGSGKESTVEANPNWWGMYRIKVKHLPVEISATAETQKPDSSEDPKTMGTAVKFINEGLYRYDFGIAVPIKKISQTQVDSTNGTLSPKSADTTNAFGIFEFYPHKTDVRNTNFSPIPYLIGGVKIGRQPLHNILAGVGWGPKFAQFYLGAMVVKQEKTGTAAQPTMRRAGYEPQVSFGLILSVKGFNDARKKNKGATQ